MIEANFLKFKEKSGLKCKNDSLLFEIFVNHLFARKNRYFNCLNDYTRFDLTNVGGDSDSGIDGVFIRVNGSFVYSKQDFDMIVKNSNSLNVEFIFIQSKNKTSIDCGELGKFFSGIKNFLRDKQEDEVNTKITDWIDLKNYIFSPDFLSFYNSQPSIYAFFVYEGKYASDVHTEAKVKEFLSDISNLEVSKEPVVEIYDGEKLFKLIKEVENNYKVTIQYNDSFELKGCENVASSMVLLCNAESLLKLIADETNNQLRKEIFTDNVRDYQGETAVNREISETLSLNPDKFCLLNNGITIVCKSCLSMNRQITLENPQIVNGCQTCTSIFNSYINGCDLKDVDLIVKVIATDDSIVTNSIIKGTNRQNVVYGEWFEITRDFHKNLEEYVQSRQINIDNDKKIYYERRSNQFANDPNISNHQKFGLSVLAQSFVSVFLVNPHMGFEHVIDLLEKFQGQIFCDDHSFEPYFVSALLFLKIDKQIKDDYEKYRYFGKYRYQIMAIFCHLVGGRVPLMSNKKAIDEYCKKIVDAIYDDELFTKKLDDSVTIFEKLRNKWIEEKGAKFIHAIKDNNMFDKFMFNEIGFPYDKLEENNKYDDVNIGVVTTVKKDRNGFSYCYIKADPVDIFVHEDSSPGTYFTNLVGKEVKYKIISTGRFANPKGKIINVLGRKTIK